MYENIAEEEKEKTAVKMHLLCRAWLNVSCLISGLVIELAAQPRDSIQFYLRIRVILLGNRGMNSSETAR